MVQLISSVNGVKVIVDGLEYNYLNGWGNYYNLEGTHMLTGEEVYELIEEVEYEKNKDHYEELGLDIVGGFSEYYVTYGVKRSLETCRLVRTLWNNECREDGGFDKVIEGEVMITPTNNTICITK